MKQLSFRDNLMPVLAVVYVCECVCLMLLPVYILRDPDVCCGSIYKAQHEHCNKPNSVCHNSHRRIVWMLDKPVILKFVLWYRIFICHVDEKHQRKLGSTDKGWPTRGIRPSGVHFHCPKYVLTLSSYKKRHRILAENFMKKCFQDAMPCSLVDICWCSSGICCLQSILKLLPVSAVKTSDLAFVKSSY